MYSDKVVLLHNSWNALFSQAASEGVLSGNRDVVENYLGISDRDNINKALSYLFLYDEVIVPHQGDIGSPRIKSLERESFFRPVKDTLEVVGKIGVNWTIEKDEQSVRTALGKILSIRKLVANALLDMELENQIPVPENFEREEYYQSVIEYASFLFSGDREALSSSNLVKKITPKLLAEIERVLCKKNRSLDAYTPVDLILFGAFSTLDHLELAVKVSTNYSAAATYAPFSSLITEPWPSAIGRADSFKLVQMAMDEEFSRFPAVTTIAEAIELRKDPNIVSFRKQLNHYQKAVASGVLLDVSTVREDLRRAAQILQQARNCEQVIKSLGYISYPAGLAETLLHGALERQ